MKEILFSVLTDKSARNPESANVVALQASNAFAPWGVE